jgi:hypothetical protein
MNNVNVQSEIEGYLQIISKLVSENTLIKNESLKARIKRLDNSMPEFARCMEKYNLHITRNTISVDLNDDEQARISNIIKKIKEIDTVKKRIL